MYRSLHTELYIWNIKYGTLYTEGYIQECYLRTFFMSNHNAKFYRYFTDIFIRNFM